MESQVKYQRIALIMAMEAEAAPLVEQLSMGPARALHHKLPMRVHSASVGSACLILAVSGSCSRFGVDCIGTEAATLCTHLVIESFTPDLIINAGTAGGFKSHGASVGDVYMSYPMVCFHDRRIAIPGFKDFGLGKFCCADFSKAAKGLGLKLGVVSTGSSLDFTPQDMGVMSSYNGEVKEMEAAAVAWVAQLHGIPFVAIKSITDIVDSPKPTEEEFLENLHRASGVLACRVKEFINVIV